MGFLMVLCTDMPRAWHGLIAASIDDTSRARELHERLLFLSKVFGKLLFISHTSGRCALQKDVLVEALSMVTSGPWLSALYFPLLFTDQSVCILLDAQE
jgi:hypothetical protein